MTATAGGRAYPFRQLPHASGRCRMSAIDKTECMQMESILLQQISNESEALVASLMPHALMVGTDRARPRSAIAWRRPYVVTAAEAVAGAEQARLRWQRASDGAVREEECRFAAIDLTTDVAVIACPQVFEDASRAPALTIRDALHLGERVAVVAADARGALAAWGSVRVLGPPWRSRRGGEIAQRLEVDAALDRRFEGALIADVRGQAAAMLVPGPRAWLGIPAATIERVLQTLERYGYLPRPYVGVRLQNLWLDRDTLTRYRRSSSRIAVIAGIERGSPAEAAQLEPGDLIDTLDGHEADGVDALTRLLAAAAPGSNLTFGVRRGGELQSRAVTIGERPRPQA
jgi:serine protease Do